MSQKNFNLYKSSAGSGKTFTLVLEYLKIVIENPSKFRNILAITFTNKAANELKERIILSLKILSNPESHSKDGVIFHMLPEIIKKTKLSEDKISLRAQKVLSGILHNYDDFAVNTIDSFTHRIIRTFAFDLHIASDFEVEMDSDQLIKIAIDELISKVGYEKDLTKTLIAFTQSKVDDEKNWQIEKELKEISTHLLKESFEDISIKLSNLNHKHFQVLFKTISAFINNFENQLSQIGKNALSIIQKADIDASMFAGGKNGIPKYYSYLSEKRSDKFIILPNNKNRIEEGIWYSGKAKDQDKLKIDAIKDDLFELYRQSQSIIKKEFDDYVVLKAFLKFLFPVALLAEIDKIQEEYKTTNNILHISEFNKRISKIVFNEPIPFIYERVGEKYKHFLIDEFQDTSILQWHNLLPLIDNSLAESNFNMIVGDGKQAIYRFRNGRVEQFDKLPEIYEKPDSDIFDEREDALKRNIEKKNLDKNFRSQKEIIEFNNNLFSFLSKHLSEDLSSIYNDCQQEYLLEKKGGYVSIELFNYEKGNSSELEKNHLSSVKNAIDECLYLKYNHKDITILCRNNKEAVKTASFLLEENYPIISSESLLLINSPAVQLLISIATFIRQPEDKINQMNLINLGLKLGFIKGEIHYIFLQLQSSRYDDQFIRQLFTENNYILNLNHLKFFEVFEIFENLIRIFKFGERKMDPFIQFFMDEVFTFTRTHSSSLSDFLDWFEEKSEKLSISVPEGVDAVRVMTIHKAKGLEFPVVIYPFAYEKQSPPPTSKWIDFNNNNIPGLEFLLLPLKKEILETKYAHHLIEEKNHELLDKMNVFYVALTRASERLYIVSNHVKQNNKTNHLNYQSFLVDYLIHLGIYSEKLNQYHFGDQKSTRKANIVSIKIPTLLKYPSYNWKHKLIMRPRSSESWDFQNAPESLSRGSLIHYILSKVNTTDQLDPILKILLSDSYIDIQEYENLKKQLSDFLKNPKVSQYFEKGLIIKNETEIISNGKVFRPDRLIFRENEIIIVDFKTGNPDDKHRKQLYDYEKAIRSLGYERIRKVLLYIDQNEQEVEV